MLILLGVAVVVVGFAAGFNPLLVVVAAALATGLAAGLPPLEVLAAFGKAFNENRYVSVALLVLPMVGVVERAGLQERARTLMTRFKGVSIGPLLIGYMVFRQITSALGLTSIAGQTQSIRPIIAPMAEGAVETHVGALSDPVRHRGHGEGVLPSLTDREDAALAVYVGYQQGPCAICRDIDFDNGSLPDNTVADLPLLEGLRQSSDNIIAAAANELRLRR